MRTCTGRNDGAAIWPQNEFVRAQGSWCVPRGATIRGWVVGIPPDGFDSSDFAGGVTRVELSTAVLSEFRFRYHDRRGSFTAPQICNRMDAFMDTSGNCEGVMV